VFGASSTVEVNTGATLRNGSTVLSGGTIQLGTACSAPAAMLMVPEPAAWIVDGLLAADAASKIDFGTTEGSLEVVGSVDLAIDAPHRFHMENATLRLAGFAGQELEVLSGDKGRRADPSAGDFQIGKVEVTSAAWIVRLVDRHDNSAGMGAEALYARELKVEAGATLDLNGHTLYYQTKDIEPGAIITGGSLRQWTPPQHPTRK
jgi:hypothetical protein